MLKAPDFIIIASVFFMFVAFFFRLLVDHQKAPFKATCVHFDGVFDGVEFCKVDLLEGGVGSIAGEFGDVRDCRSPCHGQQ